MNLKDKNLYFIGGVVRDELLGQKSLDVDLTYDGDVFEFVKTIKNVEIIRINKPFGTVKIKLNGKEIDIASTRNEIYPRKGHLPVVKNIACSLKEDVLRRDFTINSLAKSTLTGEIIDYTGGLKDLKNHKIRVLHDNSFIDDPTRILRALKFSVRFGFELEKHTKELQKQYLDNINYDMSYKRLQKELKETFISWNAFERFINENIYKLVSPLDFELPKNITRIKSFNSKNLWIVYLGLLPDISKIPLTKTEKRIVEEYKKLKTLSFASDFDIYKYLSNIPIESVIMFSTLKPKIVDRFFKIKDIKTKINGNDLKNIGIKPSEKYGKCFDFILKEKLKNPNLSKKDEIELAKSYFNCNNK